MESLGFTHAPMTASTSANRPQSARSVKPHRLETKESAVERTLTDWKPDDATTEYLQRRIRWGMVAFVGIAAAALTIGAFWLWQRPAVEAETALVDLTRQAEALRAELVELENLNDTLLEPDLDVSAVSRQSLTVDSQARSLFDVSGAMPASSAATRSLAADVAATSLDASRLISDATAYRSAVLPVLSAPELETDPELIELDEAVRHFGEWQTRFNDVRSALPSNTLTDVSQQLTLISGNLEGIQSDYIDGLREDDRLAASRPLEDLATQLSQAELTLFYSLSDIQKRVATLLAGSLAGIDRLLR